MDERTGTHPLSPTIVTTGIGFLLHPPISTHTELPGSTRGAVDQYWVMQVKAGVQTPDCTGQSLIHWLDPLYNLQEKCTNVLVMHTNGAGWQDESYKGVSIISITTSLERLVLLDCYIFKSTIPEWSFVGSLQIFPQVQDAEHRQALTLLATDMSGCFGVNLGLRRNVNSVHVLWHWLYTQDKSSVSKGMSGQVLCHWQVTLGYNRAPCGTLTHFPWQRLTLA